jgi:hypothetical protein
MQERFPVGRVAQSLGSTVDSNGTVGACDHAHHDPRTITDSAAVRDGIRLLHGDDRRIRNKSAHHEVSSLR